MERLSSDFERFVRLNDDGSIYFLENNDRHPFTSLCRYSDGTTQTVVEDAQCAAVFNDDCIYYIDSYNDLYFTDDFNQTCTFIADNVNNLNYIDNQLFYNAMNVSIDGEY